MGSKTFHRRATTGSDTSGMPPKGTISSRRSHPDRYRWISKRPTYGVSWGDEYFETGSCDLSFRGAFIPLTETYTLSSQIPSSPMIPPPCILLKNKNKLFPVLPLEYPPYGRFDSVASNLKFEPLDGRIKHLLFTAF